MLGTYDRYMREYKAKVLKERLKREERDQSEVIPSTIVGLFIVRQAQRERQAVKDTMRNMEGQ